MNTKEGKTENFNPTKKSQKIKTKMMPVEMA